MHSANSPLQGWKKGQFGQKYTGRYINIFYLPLIHIVQTKFWNRWSGKYIKSYTFYFPHNITIIWSFKKIIYGWKLIWKIKKYICPKNCPWLSLSCRRYNTKSCVKTQVTNILHHVSPVCHNTPREIFSTSSLWWSKMIWEMCKHKMIELFIVMFLKWYFLFPSNLQKQISNKQTNFGIFSGIFGLF